MTDRIGRAIGFDLGLNTGWAIVAWRRHPAKPRILACGNVDVRREAGLSARLLLWHAHVAVVVGQARDSGVTGAAYEQIHRMLGQGGRYILMQEGIINVAVPSMDIPTLGVPQATLRKHAGFAGMTKGTTWADRSLNQFHNPELLRSEDQAVAAFAATWLMCNATKT